MSILGIGSDIIEIARMQQAYARHAQRLFDRLLTQQESAYCFKYRNPIPHLAGRFAAKEAVLKALGTGLQQDISWHDIEILNNTLGKPEVHLHPKLLDRFGPITIFLTISHCHAYATATALITQNQ